jgi:hypothetical protein
MLARVAPFPDVIFEVRSRQLGVVEDVEAKTRPTIPSSVEKVKCGDVEQW